MARSTPWCGLSEPGAGGKKGLLTMPGNSATSVSASGEQTARVGTGEGVGTAGVTLGIDVWLGVGKAAAVKVSAGRLGMGEDGAAVLVGARHPASSRGIRISAKYGSQEIIAAILLDRVARLLEMKRMF
jgi:hypothetical protein